LKVRKDIAGKRKTRDVFIGKGEPEDRVGRFG
jgi:hypothetical protein